MSDVHAILVPRSAFAHASPSRTQESRDLNGVIARDRDGIGIATLHVRKGQSAVLARRMLEHFRIELPQGPYRTTADDFALAGTGPRAWLATHKRGDNAFAVSLREKIGDLASVSDQSDGYAVLQLSGPKVCQTLAKMLPIDLHPLAFKPGHVAVTVAGHMGATIWRLGDRNDGSPAFEIAVNRSLATDFWHFLSDNAAQFGLMLASTDPEPRYGMHRTEAV